jgi:hypothetical protein
MIDVHGGARAFQQQARLAGDEHEVVEKERVLAILEQLGDPNGAAGSVEDVDGRDLAAER